MSHSKFSEYKRERKGERKRRKKKARRDAIHSKRGIEFRGAHNTYEEKPAAEQQEAEDEEEQSRAKERSSWPPPPPPPQYQKPHNTDADAIVLYWYGDPLSRHARLFYLDSSRAWISSRKVARASMQANQALLITAATIMRVRPAQKGCSFRRAALMRRPAGSFKCEQNIRHRGDRKVMMHRTAPIDRLPAYVQHFFVDCEGP